MERRIANHRISLRRNIRLMRIGFNAEWKLAIVAILFLTLTMTGAFDSLFIHIMGFREVPRSVRAASAVLVFAIISLSWFYSRSPAVIPTPYRRTPAFEVPILIMVALIPFWIIAGLLNQWPITYVVGDIFMLGILPLSYFALSRRPVGNVRGIFYWLYVSMLIGALFSLSIVIYSNIILGNTFKISLDAGLPVIYYSLLRGGVPWIEILFSISMVFGVIISTKRGTWAGLMLLVALTMVLRRDRGKWIHALAFVVLVSTSMVLLYLWSPEFVTEAGDKIEYRIDETKEDLFGGGELSATSGGRMSEIVGVYDTIVERRNPVDWLLGLGLGAVVSAREGRTRHHIHSTPAAFVARTGFVGLFLWLWFLWSVALFLFKGMRESRTRWCTIQFQFWLGLWILSSVMSVKSLAFWGSAMTGIQLAYLRHLAVRNEMENAFLMSVRKRWRQTVAHTARHTQP